jgi:hypothetical protein
MDFMVHTILLLHPLMLIHLQLLPTCVLSSCPMNVVRICLQRLVKNLACLHLMSMLPLAALHMARPPRDHPFLHLTSIPLHLTPPHNPCPHPTTGHRCMALHRPYYHQHPHTYTYLFMSTHLHTLHRSTPCTSSSSPTAPAAGAPGSRSPPQSWMWQW